MIRRHLYTLLCVWLIGLGCNSQGDIQKEKIPVRVVVVSMFEVGEDSGDTPGELQYWVEGVPLNEKISFPQGYRDLRYNAEKGILGILTGVGTARAAASVMALGMDDRFDLSKTYWIVAGISGIDPEDASLGSAAWAEWLVDGDLAHEIDPREAPKGWKTGYLPLTKSTPFEKPLPEEFVRAVFRLNPSLVNWAYQLTREIPLDDDDDIRFIRNKYSCFPNAQKPPFVLKGDQLSASTYWHGKLMNDWANDWAQYWTKGSGNYVTSAMEDTGTMQALSLLDQAGKVDAERVLVLRTASNYTMQYDGVSAAESLSGKELSQKGYTAYIPALKAAYIVAGKVVEELCRNWEKYEDKLPKSGGS